MHLTELEEEEVVANPLWFLTEKASVIILKVTSLVFPVNQP
jgi:hypothetical protein